MIQAITDHLAMMAQFRRDVSPGAAGVPFEQWLLDHGEAFGPQGVIPEGLDHLQEMKECYSNSAQALTTHALNDDQWVYAEGYGVRHSLGIPLEHAWLVHRGTREVLDLTWKGECSYFGIPYAYPVLVAQLMKRKIYGLHSDGVMYNRDLMKMDPGIFRAWPKAKEPVT